jgi:hypothetical protein
LELWEEDQVLLVLVLELEGHHQIWLLCLELWEEDQVQLALVLELEDHHQIWQLCLELWEEVKLEDQVKEPEVVHLDSLQI